MKKLVLGAVAAATVAVPLAVAPAIAGATGGGSTPPANQITISSIADYGLQRHAARHRPAGPLHRRQPGFVDVEVDQYYPETPNPLGAHGFSAPTAVVCDGQTRHVTATIVGTALRRRPGEGDGVAAAAGPRSAQKWITIVAH